MNDRTATVNNDLLNSCIEVRSVKIDNRVTIPQHICFCLNARILAAIEQIIVKEQKFRLSSANLAVIRCYALFNLPVLTQIKARQLYLNRSCLIFSTRYAEGKSNDILLRSTIDPQGKISLQIKREILQNPALLERVSEAHYWLIAEILTQLLFKSKSGRYWLIYSCLVLTTFAACNFIWYFLAQSLAFKLIICLFLVGVQLIAIALGKRLKSQITHHLVKKVFSQRTIERQLSLKIINFLV